MDSRSPEAVRVTELLIAWSGGRREALDELLPLVYNDLRRLAAAYMRREAAGHSMQPTALVHETYVRLVDQRQAGALNRAQFFGVAAEMMRRILVDRARARLAVKRSGKWARVTLDPGAVLAEPVDIDVLDLDVALTKLAELDARKSRIAELRFFGGLSLEEAAEFLDLSLATVERDWQFARAWLFDALAARPADES